MNIQNRIETAVFQLTSEIAESEIEEDHTTMYCFFAELIKERIVKTPQGDVKFTPKTMIADIESALDMIKEKAEA